MFCVMFFRLTVESVNQRQRSRETTWISQSGATEGNMSKAEKQTSAAVGVPIFVCGEVLLATGMGKA